MKFDELHPNANIGDRWADVVYIPAKLHCSNCEAETKWGIYKCKDFFAKVVGLDKSPFVAASACSEECLEELKTRALFFSQQPKGTVSSWETKLVYLAKKGSVAKDGKIPFSLAYGLKIVEKWLKHPFCPYCNKDMAKTPLTKISFDHIIPRSKGGAHALSNLTPCCIPCNHEKSDKLLE